MHIHLIGVCGTGMGALAGLLRDAGHDVSGSDRAFYPPMGPALEAWGVRTMPGWDAANLDPAPDLVVVGNVCRKDNPEAVAAHELGLRCLSFPGTLNQLFLQDRPGYVVAGTHGKTTTTAILAQLLHAGGRDPGFLIGGVPRGFDRAARLGRPGAPFVIEGDEYDSAYFEKTPKFWQYNPRVVILTSVEHDHVDIYPDPASYRAAFEGLIARIPEDGLLVAYAGDPEVRELAKQARCPVRFYALASDDCGDVAPIYSAALAAVEAGAQPFDLFGGGSFLSRVYSPLSGAHNVRNVLAAVIAAVEGAGLQLGAALETVPHLAGVKRRQELLGVAGGVYVYEDFAHHPTAVRETLKGLRSLHPRGKLIAAFEPRSATASRRMHQDDYPAAFLPADVTLIAPVGRPEIPADERLDVDAIVAELVRAGKVAEATPDVRSVAARVAAHAEPGDVVVLMSNGDFGGVYDEVLVALTPLAQGT
jgi:UDP-N-acetylmuramate: L-alanyl-gamma-D-glutamyl-meso-diaminopimelate ligase